MRKLIFAIIVLTLLMPVKARAAIRTQAVEYMDGNTILEGYLAYDDALTGLRPGVLIAHEWTGLGGYIKRRTEEIAKLGYVAFAVDIYGKGIRPINSTEAAEEASIFKKDRNLMRKRIIAGLRVLLEEPGVDKKRIAAIGYCFGGTTVLELARSGADIAGVVSFHGGLDTPNLGDAKNIRAKILVLHGANDPFAPTKQVLEFEDEMRNAGVDWQLVLYGGAVHSFTNPDSGNEPAKGMAYNKEADARSWEAMKAFFQEIFTSNK